jgi:DNA-binding transcriptional ArsR family regulator
MNKLAHKVKDYIQSTFATELIYTDDEPSASVPIQLRKYCTTRIGIIRGINFNFVFLENDRLMHEDSKNLLNKLIKKLEKFPVILVFSKEETKRSPDRFLLQHVGHIIPNKRCYIPQFLLDVTSIPEPLISSLGSRQLGVLATLITCQYIEGDIDKTTASSEIHLDVSRTSKSKALKEMESAGVIIMEKQGRVNIVTFLYERLKLWSLRKELFSPLNAKPILIYREYVCIQRTIRAGESALSHYTLLGEPRHLALAVDSSEAGMIISSNGVEEAEHIRNCLAHGVIEHENVIELYVFTHMPKVIMQNGTRYLSPISTLLSNIESSDPRTRSCINELAEEVTHRITKLDRLNS